MLSMDAKNSTATITVFTRHSADCPKTDPQWKRCTCRKSLYLYIDGRVSYRSAKTRSWERAERVAQAERDLHDPVKIRLREIEAEENAKALAAHEEAISIPDALTRWVASRKLKTEGTLAAYVTFQRKVKEWAVREGITYLHEVTAGAMDAWRGQWSEAAAQKFNRIGPTTQSLFQSRLKSFFGWARRIDLIQSDPTTIMAYIKPSTKRTQVLTLSQFEELLKAIGPFTAAQPGDVHEFAPEFRALFLPQRWSGLRIQDCLLLPRTGIVGNRLRLVTKKNGAKVGRILPDCAIAALNVLSPDRRLFRPDYFFWSKKLNARNLSTRWDRLICRLNKYLSLLDEHGQPMKFHSHMLRDTYAVEMLLAGVSLEDVSRLLTHKSIRTTERFYAHWVKSRRDQLDDKAVAAMRRMGVVVRGQ